MLLAIFGSIRACLQDLWKPWRELGLSFLRSVSQSAMKVPSATFVAVLPCCALGTCQPLKIRDWSSPCKFAFARGHAVCSAACSGVLFGNTTASTSAQQILSTGSGWLLLKATTIENSTNSKSLTSHEQPEGVLAIYRESPQHLQI